MQTDINAAYFKSIIDQDRCSVVICNLKHEQSICRAVHRQRCIALFKFNNIIWSTAYNGAELFQGEYSNIFVVF